MSTNSTGGSIAYGKAVKDNGGGIPVIGHNGFGKAITDSDLLTIPAAVVLSASSNASSSQSVGLLDLTWGRWAKANVQVKNTTLSNTANANPGSDVMWAVFKPAPMTGLASGTIRYGNNSSITINGIDHTGGALQGGVFEFDVTFGLTTDAITNGSLKVFDSSNAVWNVTFGGDISGAYATMTDISGTLNGTASATGVIGGVFTGATGNSTPDFVGGFSLKSGSSYVQGITLLNNEDCFTCAVVP